MILFSAIDIREGHAVRLVQGDYEQETRYDADPADAAARWYENGARWLHVVDLDGAREGQPRNLDALRRVVAAVGCPVQAGGGLRDPDAVAAALDAGAQRVVIGTAALRDPEFLAATLDEHGDRVIVAVDARQGSVVHSGWREKSDIDPAEAVRKLSDRGVARFLFTPVDVDGTMAGPGTGEMRRVAQASEAQLLYSGGVGDLEDLRSLAAEAPPNLEGVVVGRALYERRFTVAEAELALNPD